MGSLKDYPSLKASSQRKRGGEEKGGSTAVLVDSIPL